MIAEFLPLAYIAIPSATAAIVARYYFKYKGDKVKGTKKAQQQEGQYTVENAVSEIETLLLNAHQYYPQIKAELDKIKATNPKADLQEQEMKLKMLEYAVKHPMIVRIALPIAKPILLRKIKQVQRSL